MNLREARSQQTTTETTHYSEIEVSFVLPCLNENATLAACIKQAQAVINQLGVPGEIIVADNGSTDGSQAIAQQLGANVVDVPTRGYGAAVIEGCRAASGRFIVMSDSDSSYNLFESVTMLDKLREGVDVVVGTRLHGKILPGAMPWKNRYFGNPALTGALNLLFRSGLSDAHCGLRAFTHSAFEQMDLRCTGMEFASEMVVKATLLGLERVEVPVTYSPDGRNRSPHLRPWRDGWRHLRFLLLYSPSLVYIIPGLLALLVGIGLNSILNVIPETTYLTFGRLFFGTHWTVPATLSAAFGLQGVFLGIITVKYSVQRGLYPEPTWYSRISGILSLEWLLVFGLLLGLVGVVIEAGILAQWISSGFGELTEIRLALYGAMWILLGAESAFNSFVLGLLTHEVETLPSSRWNHGYQLERR
ncbi:MAG: glycosyltransferase family 2 protein [Anaerolineaceae bacterium]|nr:glycosyltransferase family 2 protein [Anaerolineaceae bacterium]